MPEEKTENTKCLLIINQGAPFKAVDEHIKTINGFYNGAGWYVEYKHKEAVSQLCQNASIRFLELPLLAESFDAFKRQHKASYFHEKSIKISLEIRRLRETLKIPQEGSIDELLNEERRKEFEKFSDGKDLLEL